LVESEQPRRGRSRRSRIIKGTALGLGVLLLAAATGTYLFYRQLEGNIEVIHPDLGDEADRPERGPEGPLNILVLGSDTRAGQTGVDGAGGDLSDTTILFHLAADRSRAYGVNIPRDLMVRRPECAPKDSGGDPVPAEGPVQFNSAYRDGGPGCTARTVEALTGIRLDHIVVVEFDGFKNMVDALGGVPVCLPVAVDDERHKIFLREGSYEVTGDEALSYFRARYGLGDGSDIARMRRQQEFLASMTNKAASVGTLVNPVKLYRFLNAVTSSISTDPGLASLGKLNTLANQVRDIGLSNIKFLTMPIETYALDPNRLQAAPESTGVWRRLRADRPLTTRQVAGSTDAEAPRGGEAKPSQAAGASGGSRDLESEEAADRERVGLCP
jgi:LCP family protein required for cell wall assembly